MEKLFPHQRAGVAFLATAERALLEDEQGVGKSATSISTLKALYLLGKNPFPALIVAPNSTKLNWKREFNLWWPGLTVNVVKGSAADRRKLLTDPAHAYVMNWESIRFHSRLAPYGSIALKRCKECGGEDERVTWAQCEVHLRELNHLTFQSVIADEAHRMKDPRSKQTRALWAATGDAAFRFALTGTPIANAIDELWSILHWISPDEWPSRSRYIDRFCQMSYNGFGQPQVIGLRPEHRDEFFRIADPRLRRMPKALVLKFLPPIVRERRDVEMGAKQLKAYREMRDRQIAELENGDVVAASSPLTRATRLMQFASAYATLEEREVRKQNGDVDTETVVRLSDPSCKLDAFEKDMEDFGDDSVVVFAVSRQLIEMLSKRLDKLGVKHGLITGSQTADQRQAHLDDFQEGKTQYILCTIQAGGVGLTLTRGRIGVFLQRSWSAVDNAQAEARIHRIGSQQHESILYIDYVTENTIEDQQLDAVQTKYQRLEEVVRDEHTLLNALKREAMQEEEAKAKNRKPRKKKGDDEEEAA